MEDKDEKIVISSKDNKKKILEARIQFNLLRSLRWVQID